MLSGEGSVDKDILRLVDRRLKCLPDLDSGDVWFKREVRAFESELLTLALKKHQGCIAAAAKSLGLNRTTFYERAKALGVIVKNTY